jgi:hypothetical protein
VFLSKEPGPGAYWAVGKNTEEGKAPYTSTISATDGRKVAGWLLSVGAAAEKLKDRAGKAYRARKVLLTPNPRPVPRFYLIEIAP